MSNVIDASTIVRAGFPPVEGTKLAEALLARTEIAWEGLDIDVKTCAPGLLISSFFNGFLQTIADKRPELLPIARKVRWRTAFEFQNANITRWMNDFLPFNAPSPSNTPPKPSNTSISR